MENFRNERCIAEAGDFLNGVDHEANEKLNKEITDLRGEGCRVKIGEKTDPAYNNPDKIQDIYNYLEQGGAELKDIRKDIIHINLAAVALASVLEKIPFVRENKWSNIVDAQIKTLCRWKKRLCSENSQRRTKNSRSDIKPSGCGVQCYFIVRQRKHFKSS